MAKPNPTNRQELKQQLSDIIRGILAAEAAMRKFELALGADIDTFWTIAISNDFANLGPIVDDEALDYALGKIAEAA